MADPNSKLMGQQEQTLGAGKLRVVPRIKGPVRRSREGRDEMRKGVWGPPGQVCKGGGRLDLSTPGSCECDLVWRQGLCGVIQVRDGLTGLGQALIQGPGSLREEGNLDTDTYGGDHMKMQVEIGMMCLQTKEW